MLLRLLSRGSTPNDQALLSYIGREYVIRRQLGAQPTDEQAHGIVDEEQSP